MNANWKYKVFTVDNFASDTDDMTFEEKLNSYGKDGWELVGFIPKKPQYLGNQSGMSEDTIVLKKLTN